jgi:hypothetical protein
MSQEILQSSTGFRVQGSPCICYRLDAHHGFSQLGAYVSTSLGKKLNAPLLRDDAQTRHIAIHKCLIERPKGHRHRVRGYGLMQLTNQNSRYLQLPKRILGTRL